MTDERVTQPQPVERPVYGGRVNRALFLIALSACAHAPKGEAMWNSISVADGSANVYRFTRGADGRIAFASEPITPEQSSTGLYSGGPPRKEDLSADDARLSELWTLLQKLAADEAKHTPDRNKGTAAVGWTGSGSREFILQMGQFDELMSLLKRFGP